MSYLHSSSTLLRLPAGHQWFRHRVAFQRVPFDKSMLVMLILLMLSGVLPIISQLERFALWGIWLLMWILILRCGFKLRASQFPKPARLFIGWLFLCCLWGVIASPVPVLDQMVRSVFYAVTAAAGLTVLGSDPGAWRRMAALAGWIIVLNLAVIYASLYVPGVENWLVAHAIMGDVELQQQEYRFAGLWKNANGAGIQTLILMVLSSWASGPAIWAARAAGVWIIYLTASRSAAYLLLLVAAFYLFNTFRNYRYGRMLALALGFMAVVGVFAGLDPVEWVSENLAGTMFWGRISDPLERASTAGPGRIMVLKDWLPYLAKAPWYGYGLSAMGGSGFYSTTGIFSFRNDLPIVAIHNMYLGMWADAGFLGFASYLVLLGVGFVAALKARFHSFDRTALFSFWAILLVTDMVANSTHVGMDGILLHLVAFMLPALPIFRHPGVFQKGIAPRGSGVSGMFKKDH